MPLGDQSMSTQKERLSYGQGQAEEEKEAFQPQFPSIQKAAKDE